MAKRLAQWRANFSARIDVLGGDVADFQEQSSPPINLAPILSLFISGQRRESFIGDLEERYGTMLRNQGRRVATIWFWRESVHSFFSLAFDTLKQISGFEKLIERYRRIGS
jgi:hypothetical protein